MELRFNKPDMWAAAGFVFDSFQADQADFAAVAPDDFGAAFAQDFAVKRKKIRASAGAALRTAATSQVTDRLYRTLEAVKPLLDRVEIRLGLLGRQALTVPAKSFGLKALRDRINAHDAEGASDALNKLEQVIADNSAALKSKGYTDQELADLQALRQALDADGGTRNAGFNANTETTQVENADYSALDQLLAKVMKTGRLLYKGNKAKRRQYEVAAVAKRIRAGERPKDDDAPGAA